MGGGTPSKANPMYWNENISWASVKDLPFNEIELNSTKDHITEEGLKNSSSNYLKKNIIICTRMGLGKIVKNNIDVAINQDLRGIVLSKNVSHDFFISYYKNIKIESQGLTVKGISNDNLMKSLFPFAEQKRIVAAIEKLLPLCVRLGK